MKKIYARKTTVQVIENSEADIFLDLHHDQKASGVKTKRSIGMFYQDTLVGVAQFCFPRTSKKKEKYSTELLRLCFKKRMRVIGGASKLIKFYIKKNNPSDIFTYQDTTGENTDVYEKCGFTLVSQDKKKEYLIKNGKTLQTANFGNKEKITMYYAAKLGPDNILGTNLGEVFKEDGSRKTNIELFLDLGWHIEETAGDKVYEWFNPDVSFYTYKITATDSNKYYYGVRTCSRDFSVDDMMKDGYYGSGGTSSNNKFKNWKEKHKKSLVKEILGVYSRKSEAYNAEKELVNDLYRTDTQCLNSIPGGYYSGGNVGPRTFMGFCEIHGKTKTTKNSCFKCSSEKRYSTKHCEIHGKTTFSKNDCLKCHTKLISVKDICDKHGEAVFQMGQCRKCVTETYTQMKECPKHGETIHMKDVCCFCTAEKPVNEKICGIHGKTVHVGETCAKCRASKNVSIQNCEKHGETKHIGSKCYLCVEEVKISLRNCPVHGLTKHSSSQCSKCSRAKTFNTQECMKHGITTFAGNTCAKCKNENAISLRECSIHGEAKHNGTKCYRCMADKRRHNKKHTDEKDENCQYCQ